MSPSVAITGVGLVTPLADRLDALTEALRSGRIAPAAPGAPGAPATAGIADFDATRYTNVRGLRLYGRPSRLGISAARLALVDAGLAEGVPPESLGTVTAASLGHVETLLEYDRMVVASGPMRGNPALMPLALPSSPGAVIALSFGAKACSMSVTEGVTGSLDALGIAARLVAEGRVRTCVVVGLFGLAPELALAAARAGWLAPDGVARPFDAARAGAVLSEAGAAVVLEREDDAHARGRAPLGLVEGQASAFAPEAGGLGRALARADVDGLGRAQARAIAGALAAAGCGAGAIGLVSAGASGAAADAAEADGLLAVLGAAGADTPVMAVKGQLGESLDAGGLLQAVAALEVLRTGRAPAIAGLEAPARTGLAYLRKEAAVTADRALVTSCSPSGGASALVLRRPSA